MTQDELQAAYNELKKSYDGLFLQYDGLVAQIESMQKPFMNVHRCLYDEIQLNGKSSSIKYFFEQLCIIGDFLKIPRENY